MRRLASLGAGFALFTSSLGVMAPFAVGQSPADAYLDGINEAELENQILSFTDLARSLNAANQSADSTACEKLDMVWNTISDTAQQPDLLLAPNAEFKDAVTFGNGSALRYWKIFSGWTNFDWAGKGAGDDENLGNEIRPYRQGHIRDTVRLTHRYGVNVKLSYVPLEGAKALGLTGQYAKRNDCVLGRLSSAVPTSVKDRFTPALSTKFFVDGASESQVLIAQHDIGGQSWRKDDQGESIIDNNFYSNYLSNRLSFEKGNLAGVGAFSRFFYTAQYFSRHILGLDYIFDPRELQANHLAEKDVTGQMVSNPKGPRFIWIVAPSKERKEEFRLKAAEDSDFRRHFLAMNHDLVPGETPLFMVYGSDTWTYNPEQEATPIGKFIVNSDFKVSEAADVRLYFRHAIQFHKIPDAIGEENPYTKDYPFAAWTEELFTTDCRLGATEKQVWPKNLAKYYGKEDRYDSIDFSQGSLDGTFLVGSTVDPRTVRFSDDRKWCLAEVMKKRLGNPIKEFFEKL